MWIIRQESTDWSFTKKFKTKEDLSTFMLRKELAIYEIFMKVEIKKTFDVLKLEKSLGEIEKITKTYIKTLDL
jgi:hypothetical protein